MSKVCIAGAGSWGLALALVLEKNGHEVTVWSALPEEIRLLQRLSLRLISRTDRLLWMWQRELRRRVSIHCHR